MTFAVQQNIAGVGQLVQVRIANGATESDEIPTNGMIVVAILLPAWTTATLTFKQGYVAGTRVLVCDGVTAATNYTVQTTASQWVPVDPAKLIGATGFVSLVSSASQGADRDIYVLLRYI